VYGLITIVGLIPGACVAASGKPVAANGEPVVAGACVAASGKPVAANGEPVVANDESVVGPPVIVIGVDVKTVLCVWFPFSSCL